MGNYDDIKVSVIVRCRNEERYIGYCLQSLDDYLTNPEIILLNDNSTDNSMRVANTFDWMDIKIGRAHLNSSHVVISYAVFCLKKKKKKKKKQPARPEIDNTSQ